MTTFQNLRFELPKLRSDADSYAHAEPILRWAVELGTHGEIVVRLVRGAQDGMATIFEARSTNPREVQQAAMEMFTNYRVVCAMHDDLDPAAPKGRTIRDEPQA